MSGVSEKLFWPDFGMPEKGCRNHFTEKKRELGYHPCVAVAPGNESMKPFLSNAEKRWLEKTFGNRVRFAEPMSRHTSLRVGGPAEAFVKPDFPEEAAKLVRWSWRNGISCRVIGDGTNLLV